MPRVLYFVGSFEQGGSERQIAELVAHLPRDRFEAHVAVCHARDDYGYSLPAASFTDLRAPRGPSVRSFRALVRLVRDLRPDVLHAVHDPQNSHARIAAAIAHPRCAVIGSLRCTRLPERTLRRERLTRRWGRALVVNSRGIRDELARRAGIENAIVIENGVDGERFAPLGRQARESARRRFGMTGPTFVLPGRIAEQKNQVEVVRAVALLRSEGAWPTGGRVLLAGRTEAHSRYAPLVDAAIGQLDVGDLVTRIAPVRDAEALLGAADAVLLPSLFEGMPNAVLESLACATPVLASPAANADALVHDGETGWVAQPHARAIASAMRRSSSATEDERKTMGALGRRRTLERFGVARMVAATCALYDRVLS